MSSTQLNIKSFQVTDDLTQRAASAKIVVAPAGQFPQPPVEFTGYGTPEALTGLSLRPNGLTLTLRTNYSGVPQHVLFKGLLEFMDDPKDANGDVFTLSMSSMPIRQPHRIPVTRVFNNYYTDQANSTTSNTILDAVCRGAGLGVGRNDLPGYTVEGTWEVIHSTPVEEAGRLLNPFNMFEFLHYYVRTDASGLQIIGVDFSQTPSPHAYALQNVISVKRHFELYMPEKRIGDLPVMLVGADIYNYASNEILPPEAGGPGATRTKPNPSNAEVLAGAGITQNVIQFKKTIISTASSKNTNEIANFETWSETTSEMEVTFEIVGQNLDIFARIEGVLTHVYSYPIGTFDDVLTDSLKDPLTTISRFDGNNTLFWSVKVTGLRVVDTKVLSKKEESYDSINGLIKSNVTTYKYEDLPARVIDTSAQFQVTLPAVRLLVQETTEETIFPAGFAFVKGKTVITHNYGDRREHVSTATQKYLNFRDSLNIVDTSVQMEDSFGLANAHIQAYLSGRAPSPAPNHNNPGSNQALPPHPNPFPSANNQVTINSTKETIGQYQLLNGEVIPMFPTLRMYEILDLAKVDFEKSLAFHISCPGMNYAGLAAVWALCLRQRDLEHSNTYWEIATVVVPLDSVPVIGSSVNAAGTLGYVTAIEHVGDTNSALSYVTVKRLHIG